MDEFLPPLKHLFKSLCVSVPGGKGDGTALKFSALRELLLSSDLVRSANSHLHKDCFKIAQRNFLDLHIVLLDVSSIVLFEFRTVVIIIIIIVGNCVGGIGILFYRWA